MTFEVKEEFNEENCKSKYNIINLYYNVLCITL